MSDVNIKGLSELQTFMSQLPDKLQANIMRGAVRAGANVLRDAAKANVPVQSGVLRDGIKVSSRSRRGVVSASVKLTGKHAYIGKWLEYGVAAHSIAAKIEKVLYFGSTFDKVVHHPGIVPHPFMRPALDTSGAQAVVAVGEYIKSRLTKEGLEAAADVEVSAQ